MQVRRPAAAEEADDMLTNQPMMTILPVGDLQRAKEFYVQKLGLRVAEDGAAPDAIILEGGRGTKVELERRAEPTSAEHTALTFEVADIEREVTELETRGVRFEDYDEPGLQTQHHIADMGNARAAWFKDPGGNILCIHQPTRARS
jgi:catechol 2,3-dioxygenase-like lactoylglutathione lyase family enzyme